MWKWKRKEGESKRGKEREERYGVTERQRASEREEVNGCKWRRWRWIENRWIENKPARFVHLGRRMDGGVGRV